ncbi:MAG: TRAP transporter small permease [Pseudooceanicola nanhaiensis]|uniref:TRAP transporter small permease n=1 Tax=Rhodobacterales TaxID=204455 RepID=UPI0040582ADA
MNFVSRGLSGLNDLVTAVCSVIVLCLVVHVTAEVVMRYVFGAPLKGTIQFVSLYYMTAISFLALGAVEQRDSHVVVEVFTGLLPSRIVIVCITFGALMSLLVAGGLTLRSWDEAVTQFHQKSFVMEGGFALPTWPTYFFVPVGFGLMALVSAWKIFCLMTGKSTGFLDGVGFEPGAPVLEEAPKD